MNKMLQHHRKHRNQVRIIGGTHRGRKLTFAQSDGLRPTPDSVRERLFNWLGQDLTGLSVLDLFSGSGALGFEAASRSARFVVLCENNLKTAAILMQQAQLLNMQNLVQIAKQEALTFLATQTQKFDVVFLDPPFVWCNWTHLWQVLHPCLNESARIYAEAEHLPEYPSWLTILREGKAGQSQFMLLQFQE